MDLIRLTIGKYVEMNFDNMSNEEDAEKIALVNQPVKNY